VVPAQHDAGFQTCQCGSHTKVHALAAVIGAVTITNPTVPVEPVSCEVAVLCRDRHDAHPQLAHASVDGGRLAAEDQGS
jgi:hypothetical protein